MNPQLTAPASRIEGLIHLLAATAQAAAHHAQAAGVLSHLPREAHMRAAKADELAKRSDALSAHVESNLALIAELEKFVNYLAASSIKSRHRSLALAALETASGHLRRECGDAVN